MNHYSYRNILLTPKKKNNYLKEAAIILTMSLLMVAVVWLLVWFWSSDISGKRYIEGTVISKQIDNSNTCFIGVETIDGCTDIVKMNCSDDYSSYSSLKVGHRYSFCVQGYESKPLKWFPEVIYTKQS